MDIEVAKMGLESLVETAGPEQADVVDGRIVDAVSRRRHCGGPLRPYALALPQQPGRRIPRKVPNH